MIGEVSSYLNLGRGLGLRLRVQGLGTSYSLRFLGVGRGFEVEGFLTVSSAFYNGFCMDFRPVMVTSCLNPCRVTYVARRYRVQVITSAVKAPNAVEP